MYIIVNENGLVSTGGFSPRFIKNGRVWGSLEEVKAHISIIDKVVKKGFYNNCTIALISFEVIEDYEVKELY